MAFICLNCKNKADIPEELKPLADSLKCYYQEVVYCKVLNTLIVANPDLLTQSRPDCEKFEQA
jgi:hypothetical protein